jgi:alkanesulfonate monooxygenase SsuD/methylene tetrahydromethanopterin reductase-like flavin-dependent oxidoreductase (luciferase family)
MHTRLFGANIPQIGVDYETTKRIVEQCEKYGFDFVWISDHLQGFLPSRSFLECWTTISALAESTRRIRLCTIVLNNLFRHPSLTAKMATTLDEISKGRLDIGIGAGWYESECLSNGIPFPQASARIQQLEEAIQVMKKLWTEDNVSFSGKYYSLKNASSNPKPVQSPHPPIWIGIMKGRSRMLKIIAQHADVWTISSIYLPEPEEYRRIRNALDDCCREFGRDPNGVHSGVGIGCVVAEDENRVREKVRKFPPTSISEGDYKARQMRLEGTSDECIEKLRMYAKIGVTRFVMNFPDITTTEPIRLFGEKVIPAFR